MKILLLHHHLRGGGVTQVLASQIRALPARVEYQLWTAQDKPPPTFSDLSFSYRALPELGYLDPETPPHQLMQLERTLYHCLQQATQQGWLIHSHNSSLGKNPILTWVLYRLAQEGAPILFQVHDFAEDARPANYALLRQLLENRESIPLAEILYPAFGRCFYAALNSRDRDFLANMPHLDANRVDLLPNAIDAPSHELSTSVDAATFRNSLNMRQQGALWTYPVRGIRRKNLGEFALLAALFPEHNYLLTLAPQNPVEVDAYDAWKHRVCHLNLPIHLNAGAVWPFDEIMAQSDGILTTSIQEGFGLAFLEPWSFSKGVAGRDLPSITRDFKNNGIVLDHLYTQLEIPLTDPQQQKLRDQYRAYASNNFKAMGVPITIDILNPIIEHKVGAWTDFAALGRDDQMDWVSTIANDPGLAARIRQHNRLERMWTISPERVQHNRQQLRQHYNLQTYGSALFKLYGQIVESQVGPNTHDVERHPTSGHDNPMLQNFLRADHLQLVRK